MLNVMDYYSFQDAYAALPASGGTIFVPAAPDGAYSWGPDGGDVWGRFRGLYVTTKPVVLLGEASAPGHPLSKIQPDADHFQNSDAIFIERLGGCTIRNLGFQYPEDMPAGSGRTIRWYFPGNVIGMHGLGIDSVTIENSPNLAVECTCDEWPGDAFNQSNYVSKLEMTGCTFRGAKSGGSLFLGGAGTNNNAFARCELDGPGYGGFHNVSNCLVQVGPEITAPDLSSVEMGDEVRGLGIAYGTKVKCVNSMVSITLDKDSIFPIGYTTLTFYRPTGPGAGQLPRGAVHLMRTSISRFTRCSFMGPGTSPALSADQISNDLVLRDSYRESAGTGGDAVHSFVINGMTNLLIDGLYHQFHAYPSLLLKTGPLGLGMSRIANAQLLSSDVTNGNVISLANGTDELTTDNVVEYHFVTGARRDIASLSVGVRRPSELVRLGGRSVPRMQSEVRPGTPGPIDVVGCTSTGTGTVSRPATGSSSYLDQCERIRVTSAAALNASASLASGERLVDRGSEAGRGGFYSCARFSVSPQGGNNNAFVGLANALSDILPSQTPDNLLNVVGVACKASSWSNWRLVWNDGAGSASTSDLGGDFPFGAGVYELELWAEPSAAVINYRVSRLDHADVIPATGVLNTNLPAASTALAMRAEINTGSVHNDPAILDVLRLHAERDFQ